MNLRVGVLSLSINQSINQSINALLYSWAERNCVYREKIKHNKNSEQIHCKTELQSSINVLICTVLYSVVWIETISLLSSQQVDSSRQTQTQIHTKCICSCLYSESDVVKYVARHGVYFRRMLSPVGRNLCFVVHVLGFIYLILQV